MDVLCPAAIFFCKLLFALYKLQIVCMTVYVLTKMRNNLKPLETS